MTSAFNHALRGSKNSVALVLSKSAFVLSIFKYVKQDVTVRTNKIQAQGRTQARTDARTHTHRTKEGRLFQIHRQRARHNICINIRFNVGIF